MKAILTGITGNLGFELSSYLLAKGMEIVPCLRPGHRDFLSSLPSAFDTLIESDLVTQDLEFSGQVNAIIHCAGIVHFQKAANQNALMMEKVIKLAKKLAVPVYYISTAFAYRPAGALKFNNAYELDKYNSEQLLIDSHVPQAIFRPSVLTGHTRTGAIRNFSGYYQIVRAFLTAIGAAQSKGKSLRFPIMGGVSDVLPVDQAASYIGQAILERCLEKLFITNPEPPSSNWTLEETLNFFGLRDKIELLHLSFEEYDNLDLSPEEAGLSKFAKHFNPYWSRKEIFPETIVQKNLVNHEYMRRVLTFYRDSPTIYDHKK
ncbi:MAG: SDR family oxidoreductase [Candidatus Paceibacterota bacterium]